MFWGTWMFGNIRAMVWSIQTCKSSSIGQRSHQHPIFLTNKRRQTGTINKWPDEIIIQEFLQERRLNLNDKESFKSLGFDSSKPTKMIIHGFIDTGFEIWVKVSRLLIKHTIAVSCSYTRTCATHFLTSKM